MMKTTTRILLTILSTALAGEMNATPPQVSNISYSQRANTKLVDIRYDLILGAGETVSVEFFFSHDDGATFPVTCTAVTGAVGAGIAAGSGKIAVWDAEVDWNKRFTDQGCIRIKATYGDQPTDTLDDYGTIPTGSVAITGRATKGQVLTVANNLADEDGLGTMAYQWNRDGNPIAGETNSTYTLTQDDFGKRLTVTASYTDGQGTAESVTSAATDPVQGVEIVDVPAPAAQIRTLEDLQAFEQTIQAALGDAPWNLVRIIGTLDLDGKRGQANYGSLSDYQFLTKVVEITGTLSLHEWSPPSGSRNLQLFSNLESVGGIRINHIHDSGTTYTSLSGLENITSISGNVFIYNGSNLTSLDGLNNLQTIGGTLEIGRVYSLQDLSGLDSLSAVQNLRVWKNLSNRLTSLAGMDSLQTVPGDMAILLNTNLATMAGSNVAHVGGALTFTDNPNVNGLSVYEWLKSLNTKSSGDDIQWRGQTFTSRQEALESVIKIIGGAVAEGTSLTANTTVLDEIYGAGTADSYQWNRGGSPIAGATGVTYTLTQDDVGAVISVTVGYTDSGSAAQTVTSAATVYLPPPTETVREVFSVE